MVRLVRLLTGSPPPSSLFMFIVFLLLSIFVLVYFIWLL